MPSAHELNASTTTVHWGYFDARLEPLLEVESGDSVTIRSVSGGRDVMPGPDSDLAILPELQEIHEQLTPRMPGHILTGPVAVKGAKAGDVLEVRIKDVQLRQNWGYNTIRPLMGALPEDFHEFYLTHIRMDMDAKVANLPWGVDLPLSPFFGVMGVAPPPQWGAISSIQPRAHGGNFDNKELCAGATVYFPVFNDGALFSAGDGHAVQGDGEVNVTAIETPMQGTFELIVRTDMELDYPRAETPTHYITMGMDADLDVAAKTALRRMIGLIQEKTNISREDAYMLCSLAADLRVTQVVNQEKGIHVMLAKTALHGAE